MVIRRGFRAMWLLVERVWGIDQLRPELRRSVLENTLLFAILMAVINGFYLILFFVILD